MRHKNRRLQLNRFTSWRKATLISLSKGLIANQSIRTTLSKAKAAQAEVEKLISIAKKNTLSAHRDAYAILGDHALVKYLFNEIAPRFKERLGGYTRIIRLGPRRGDNAEVAILELTEIKKKDSKAKKVKTAKEEKSTAVEAIETETKITEETKGQEERKEKPPVSKKPDKKFFKGLRQIFKKERDSL